MGLTERQKNLVQAVSQNNITLAKKCAISCIAEDTTAKNSQFCSKYKTILESSANNMTELPRDLKNILYIEDVSISFKERRYYLSEREKAIMESIIMMKKVNEKLMEMGIPYLNSTLLHGESGTGKTTFGRYIAFKTGLPFYYLNFANLVDSYMGGTSKNISKVFVHAASNPCVLMLDEIDCIGTKRESGRSNTGDEIARTTITTMQELDRLTNDTIVIGATNMLEQIDKALLRRFSIKHEVQTLNDEERTEMVKRFLADVKMDFPQNEISDLVNNNKNQSILLNKIVRIIAKKIETEMRVDE